MLLGSVSNTWTMFNPMLHLKISRKNAFTSAYNHPEFRFDIGRSTSERERLLNRKEAIVEQASDYAKHPAAFFDEDG